MAETKMTKKMWYEEIKGVVADAEVENKEGMIEFIDAQLAQLAAKAEKAAERAAQKKVEGDALRDTIESVLTTELQTIDEIAAKVAGEDVTKAKVTARLTQLVKAERATKDTVKTADGRKVVAYKLA